MSLYNTRAALGFAYIAVAFLILVVSHVYGTRQKSGISCCGAKVCAEQHHHN